jgi:hypothetical protein
VIEKNLNDAWATFDLASPMVKQEALPEKLRAGMSKAASDRGMTEAKQGQDGPGRPTKLTDGFSRLPRPCSSKAMTL